MQSGMPPHRSGITFPCARPASGLASLRGMGFPMRFLVHASGDRMFGLSLHGAPLSKHAPLPSVARAALIDALAFPLRTLDAFAAPFFVATTHQAAVAVAPVSASTGVSSASRAVKGGTALWVTLAVLAGIRHTTSRPLSLPPSCACT
eukprot:834413-Pleurochrysis_carterae.AAC.2